MFIRPGFQYCRFGNGNFFVERPLNLIERRERQRNELRHYTDPNGLAFRIGVRPKVCATAGCASHRSCNRCVEMRYGNCSCARHQNYCPRYGYDEYTHRRLMGIDTLF